MASPLFELADVQAISGETYTEPELTQVNRFIAIAQAKLRSNLPGLDDRITAGTLDPVLVQGVGATVVMRALDTIRRGLGVVRTEYPEISTQYATGDGNTNLVYLTDDDLADLVDTADNGGDCFSISLVPQ